jgi:hypothetical protein
MRQYCLKGNPMELELATSYPIARFYGKKLVCIKQGMG